MVDPCINTTGLGEPPFGCVTIIARAAKVSPLLQAIGIRGAEVVVVVRIDLDELLVDLFKSSGQVHEWTVLERRGFPLKGLDAVAFNAVYTASNVHVVGDWSGDHLSGMRCQSSPYARFFASYHERQCGEQGSRKAPVLHCGEVFRLRLRVIVSYK